MAEELQQYGSDSSINKRKYDDSSPSPASAPRRPTGFSAPISSNSPPTASYNNVPPPVDEIQLAKQKAQEIAARLFNNAEVKRPRFDNGDSNDDGGVKPYSSVVTPTLTGSYGYGSPNKKIEIPNGRVGVIIGKGGETIKYLQLQSGAKIQVTRDMDADPNSQSRGVELTGTPDQIAKAEQLIHDVLAEADTGGSGLVSRRITGQQSGAADQFVMKIPNNKVGLVIGKGGETIKSMQATTGARIQVIPLHLPPGDTSTERTCQIDGTSDQIEAAKQLVNEVISENRLRNPSMGGYPQQGYQARPPTNWGQGAPMQQPGYGYMQPGSYPGQNPQYNTGQAPYSGYPPQPTAGGYGGGWDQASGAPQSQQTSQGAGYDYYSQQPPAQHPQAPGGPGAAAENASYGYGQTPASGYSQGQGYGQDGYGGYSAAPPQSYYGSQANSAGGYDQQQGYNSTSGYGNPPSSTPDGTASYGRQGQGDANQTPQPVQSAVTGQQGYVAGQQPSSNPSYPSQGTTGYAVPPSSQSAYGSQPPTGYGAGYGTAPNPPANQPSYGQPQQSPSAQGGYSQSAPAYPTPAQSGYAQPDASGQRPAASYGAPTAQPGYGAPPYGAQAATQQSYGQPPPPYNTAYGGGYSQPPAYADSSSGASAQPPTQPAKASPPS